MAPLLLKSASRVVPLYGQPPAAASSPNCPRNQVTSLMSMSPSSSVSPPVSVSTEVAVHVVPVCITPTMFHLVCWRSFAQTEVKTPQGTAMVVVARTGVTGLLSWSTKDSGASVKDAQEFITKWMQRVTGVLTPASSTVTLTRFVAVTVTLKLHIELLPQSSVAVQITGVVPTGKVLPLAGRHATVGVASQLSMAVGAV